jgi:hypothetical protein
MTGVYRVRRTYTDIACSPAVGRSSPSTNCLTVCRAKTCQRGADDDTGQAIMLLYKDGYMI